MSVDLKAQGRAARRARVLELADRHGLDIVVLRRPANFAWYTGGADSRVDRSIADGVADMVITPAGDFVVTSTIEAPRMRAEQTPEFAVLEHPWHEDPDSGLRLIAATGAIGADRPVAGARRLDAEIAQLRRVLDADAIARLRGIGADAAAAVAETAEAVTSDMDELEAAANLAAACRSRGLIAPVLLAAGERRIPMHRHGLPFGGPIDGRAMLAVSAERGGLFANLTLFVELEEPSPALARRHAACEEILKRMRDEATRPGRTLADAFADCRRFYAEAGFPDEWRLHHQGGTTGYGSREIIATPTTIEPIQIGQAFAWNPSITGSKSEETFVLTAAGPELVTCLPTLAAG
jgi:Xaa-Pro dipeptidase